MEVQPEPQNYHIDLESCPMPVLLVRSDGEILHTNSRLDTLFGYAPSELIGQLVEVLVPTPIRSSHPELREAFFEVLTNRDMGTGRDLHGVTKGGELLPVEIGLEPIQTGEETMVLVSVLDIRERLIGESRIRRAIDAASSGMLEVDQDGVITLVNRRVRDMFGYEEEELLGQKLEVLVPRDSRRRHAVYRVSYQTQHEERTMGQGRDLYALRKDGSEFPVEIGLTPITGPNGTSTLATVIDITERKRVENQIRHNAEQLQLANEELTSFAYSASHDLKSPLSSIAALLDFCRLDLEQGQHKEVQANLERASGLASKLAGRIESLLSFARTSIQEEDWGHIEVEQCVKDSWEALQASRTESPVQLETSFEFSKTLHTIPALFQVIVENLLSNARKFRHPQREARIRVKTWEEEGTFHFSLSDNGVGIPEECHQKVFQLFQRFNPEVSSGSGLGLALVKKNVLALKGHISFESDEEGTTFLLCLPQNPDHISQATHERTAP